MSDIIDSIKKEIKWLEKHRKSPNILAIAQVLDSIAIWTVYLGELKADAYDLMSDAEDAYKHAIAGFISEYPGSAAKGEREAEVVHIESKKEWTDAKKLYKRYDIWLERIDRVLDAHRQRVSVEKQTGLKNMVGT